MELTKRNAQGVDIASAAASHRGFGRGAYAGLSGESYTEQPIESQESIHSCVDCGSCLTCEVAGAFVSRTGSRRWHCSAGSWRRWRVMFGRRAIGSTRARKHDRAPKQLRSRS